MRKRRCAPHGKASPTAVGQSTTCRVQSPSMPCCLYKHRCADKDLGGASRQPFHLAIAPSKPSSPNLVRASKARLPQLRLAVAVSGMSRAMAFCAAADANCSPLRPQPNVFDGLENGPSEHDPEPDFVITNRG